MNHEFGLRISAVCQGTSSPDLFQVLGFRIQGLGFLNLEFRV